MKNSFNYLLCLLIVCSCSYLATTPSSRHLASDSDPVSLTFRLYGKQEYLPRKVRIFNRLYNGEVDLKINTNGETVTCSGLTHSEKEMVKETISTDNVSILYNASIAFVDCEYSGEKQNVDINVDYLLKHEQVVLVSPFSEQLKAEEALLLKLQSNEWKKDLEAFIVQNKLQSDLQKTVQATGDVVEAGKVEAGDWIQFSDAYGTVTYGISHYGIDGVTTIPSSDRAKLVFPDSRAYALICGTKNGSNYTILIEGKKIVKDQTVDGTLFCVANVKQRSYIKASGSFSVKMSHVSKKAVAALINEKILATKSQIATWEAQNQQQGEVNKENLKALRLQVEDKKRKDEAHRFKEPPRFCSRDVEGKISTYGDTKRLVLGEVGEFCASPVPGKNKQFMTVCDGIKTDHYSGKMVIFDSNLKLISKNILKATSEENTVSAEDFPMSRRDATGMVKDFVLATKDGRILFYDLNGKLIRTHKLEYSFINSPTELQDGTLASVASEDLYSDNQRAYYFTEEGVVEQIELPSGATLSGPYVAGENHYYLDYDGLLLGFSKDRKKILEIVLDKKETVSPPALLSNGNIVVGTGLGHLYEIDLATSTKRVIHRARFSGRTSYSFTSQKMEPQMPSINFTPQVFPDGKIMFATSGDGRVHMIDAEGEVLWQIDTPVVNGLLNFGPMAGTDYFLTGSISYITIFDKEGKIVARYSNSGAENPYDPLPVGQGKFLSGMYNGVFQFELKPTQSIEKTTQSWPCD